MLALFGYAAGIVSVIAIIPYIRDILRGTTKPERASWLIWSVLGTIAFFSQLAKGASDSLWMTGAQTIIVVIVFAISLKYGVGGLAKRDLMALVAAGVGLVLWVFTREALLALIITISIDSLGTALTAIKAYHEPASETMATWALYGAAGILGALAVGRLDYPLLAYPAYIFAANIVVVGAIWRGRRKGHARPANI